MGKFLDHAMDPESNFQQQQQKKKKERKKVKLHEHILNGAKKSERKVLHKLQVHQKGAMP